MPPLGFSAAALLVALLVACGAGQKLAHEDVLPPCVEVGYQYLPNMEAQFRTVEVSWQTCQTRCKLTHGCTYFSFWPDGGCHLQPAHAKHVDDGEWAKDSVISGPTSCDDVASIASSSGRSREENEEEPSLCPGTFDLAGYGTVSLVPTGWMDTKNASAAQVKVLSDSSLVPTMTARAYFADTCTSGSYDPAQYLALNLLGKRMRFSVDVSGAGCGCNAAFYFTSMRQNKHASECFDYYCDANNVCGESCAEIDVMEANQYSWHSTLHSAQDHGGLAAGFGGGGKEWNGPRDFAASEYGPGARCVDTNKPFQVEVAFVTDSKGSLKAMEVTLSQAGSSCPLTMTLDNYEGMAEMSKALEAGMTPIVSYWSADDMLWLDGEGADHAGSCHVDNATKCGESIKMYGFSIESLPESTVSEKSASNDDVEKRASGHVSGAGDQSASEDDIGESKKVIVSDSDAIIEVVPMPKLNIGVAKTADGPTSTSATSCSATGSEDCRHSRCCQEAGMQCYEKHEFWAACLPSCASDSASDPWTCLELGSEKSSEQEKAAEHHSGDLLTSLEEPASDESDCEGCEGSTGLMFIRKHLRMADLVLPTSGRPALAAAALFAAGALASGALGLGAVAAWRRAGGNLLLRGHGGAASTSSPELERLSLLDVELASNA